VKGLEELDHYEVLEVPRDAGREEIERAYQLVSAAYAGDSLAAYSVFEDEEADALRERIERAYRVLSDPATRSAYDAAVLPEADAAPGVPEADPFEPLEHADEDRGVPIVEPPASRPVEAQLAFEELEGDDEAAWDGVRLRRARLLRGVELDGMAAVTKVNPTYLRFLEEDRFDDLPAAVYVRGFVVAYARHLGLDAARVSHSYTTRLEEHRNAKPRGRQLGRR